MTKWYSGRHFFTRMSIKKIISPYSLVGIGNIEHFTIGCEENPKALDTRPRNYSYTDWTKIVKCFLLLLSEDWIKDSH